jgi:glycosyltransferase involved in cell wall biosynthesis
MWLIMSDANGRHSDAAISLVLFFTREVSLRDWEAGGMLTREYALFRRLQQYGVKVTFVTYGDKSDLHYAERFPNIKICFNRWRLPLHWYERLLPNGADVALYTAKFWRKPLIVRCGYLLSKNTIFEQGTHSAAGIKHLAMEEKVFKGATHIIVTTEGMKSDVSRRVPGVKNKISVLPNYVDEQLFAPRNGTAAGYRKICFVGRLSREKNIQSLISAVQGLDVALDIIGDGVLREQLETQARRNPRVRFLGLVANELLPSYLTKCFAFVLPSLYEGHPKALIEAMSCGLSVIGTDVSGINEIIQHEENGILCGTDPDAIRKAVMRLLVDDVLCQRLGSSARDYVINHFALSTIVEQEMRICRRISGL